MLLLRDYKTDGVLPLRMALKGRQSRYPLMVEAAKVIFLSWSLIMEWKEAVESADQTQQFEVSFVYLLFIQHVRIGARPSGIKA